jgi:hypothetical protein
LPPNHWPLVLHQPQIPKLSYQDRVAWLKSLQLLYPRAVLKNWLPVLGCVGIWRGWWGRLGSRAGRDGRAARFGRSGVYVLVTGPGLGVPGLVGGGGSGRGGGSQGPRSGVSG